MISISEALAIHEVLIDKFGGKKGIRDQGGLEAALQRPYATFDGKDLYPLPADKAAAILESVIINHPFIDGNKRIGYVLMRLTLLQAGLDLSATQDEKYNFVISISKGDLDIERIKDWIKKKIK